MKGYRCENLFGDNVTDPIKVAIYECKELGNSDIPEYILKNSNDLTYDEQIFLNNFLTTTDFNEFFDEEFFTEIIKKYIGNRNYCKWLCSTPENIYFSYVAPFEQEGVSLELFLETEDITEYEIPNDAIILSDIDMEGVLYVWHIGDC